MAAAPNGDLFVGRNSLPASTKSQNACIFRSKDDGLTWTYLIEGWDKSNITTNKITGIAFGSNNMVYATTEKTSGTFISTNNGDSWVSENTGISGDGSARAVIVTNRNHVFLSEKGPSVYSHIDPTMSVNDNENRSAYLHYASPLPANSDVAIVVSTVSSATLRLHVYSAQGLVVRPEVKREVSAGMHRMSLDVSGLANGLYAYQLFVDGVPSVGTFIVSHD